MKSMAIKWLLYLSLTLLRRRWLMVTKMKQTKSKLLNQQFTGLTLTISSMTMILRQKIGILQLKHFVRYGHLYNQPSFTFQTVPSGCLGQFQNQIVKNLLKR